jgi:hypothetical protein
VVTRENFEIQNPQRTLAQWPGQRQVQEGLDQRIYGIVNLLEPLNPKLPSFLSGFMRWPCTYVTLGLSSTSAGRQKMWALVFGQENRRMTRTAKASSEEKDTYVLLSGAIEALRRTHPSERVVISLGRGDPRVGIYPPEIADILATTISGKRHTPPREWIQ